MFGALLALALVVPQAAAQDAPAPDPLWQGEAWFEERGVAHYDAKVVSLARAQDGSSWLAALADGTLIRSIDGARTWKQVLRAAGEMADTSDEAVLLDAEAVAQESAAEQADAVESAAEDGTGSDFSTGAAAETANERGAGRKEGDLAGDSALRSVDIAASGATVWYSASDPGLALAGRPDGVWRSVDGGLTWTRADASTEARSFLEQPASGTILAGTSSGIRTSPDGGERWLDVEGATDGAAVTSFGLVGAEIVAATSRGLYASTDALHWRALALHENTTAVLGDPAWPGGMWAATPTGVLRSDDDGATFSGLGRQPLRGVVGLEVLPGAAHVLAFGHDGVWETTDGGVTWHPVSNGLRDPEVRAAVIVDGRPIIATTRALWRLSPMFAGGLGARPSRVITESDQRMLGLLVEVATERTGLDLDRVSVRRLAAKAYLPQLAVEGIATTKRDRATDYLAGDTIEGGGLSWSISAHACFGGCAAGAVADFLDFADDYGVAGLIDATEFDVVDPISVINELSGEGDYVINGELVGQDGEALAATNVAQKIRKYRLDVADQVAGAWSALVRLRSVPAPDSLTASVDQTLKVAELEARLDLYTDGAYTRAKLMEP